MTEHGGIDVVYNNAGVFKMGDIATLSLADWTWSVDRELTQVFSVTRAAWHHLVARGGGAIVNTASRPTTSCPLPCISRPTRRPSSPA